MLYMSADILLLLLQPTCNHLWSLKVFIGMEIAWTQRKVNANKDQEKVSSTKHDGLWHCSRSYSLSIMVCSLVCLLEGTHLLTGVLRESYAQEMREAVK
jgi:hypothetical protein